MNEQALIIFVRNPVLGKVKTRLAATIGAEATLEIYIKLLHHTHAITKDFPADKFLWYADEVNTNDIWENEIYQKKKQIEGELGEKMRFAFEQVFNGSYKRCCIIGSDCMELSENILSDAFSQLHEKNIVIGPSFDGGYYLLGMNRLTPHLFENKEWSTDSVFDATVKDCRANDLTLFALPQLNDIDTEADWNHYLQNVTV